MMVGVTSDEQVPADIVVSFNAFDDVDRKRDLRYPGFTRRLVGEVELCRRSILDYCFCSQIVLGGHEQVRLLPTHKVDVAHRPDRIAWKRRRPEQTGRSSAEKIRSLD